MSRIRRERGNVVERAGQGLIEFALVLPILVLLASAIFELGFYMFCMTTLQNAARDGGRIGAVGSSNTVIDSTVRARAMGVPISAVVVQVFNTAGQSISSTDRTTGNTLEVEARFDYIMITPMAALSTNQALPVIRQKVAFRIE